MATQAQIAAVQQLYIGYLGRAADSTGLTFWTNALSAGTATTASIATAFTQSTEYKTNFGGLTNDALVEKVYTSVLGRASDAAGKAYWLGALTNGSLTSDKLVATFINSLSAPDQTIINNKTFVAQTYTDAVGVNYNTSAGTSVLVGVNGTPASVTAAITSITSGTLGGLVPGVALINAIATANAAVDTYAKAAAVTNPTFDTSKDGAVSSAEATAALTAANTARTAAGDATSTVTNSLASANTDLVAAKAAAVAAGNTSLVSTYDAAIAAQKALVGTATPAAAATAAAAAENSALAAADVALTANAALTPSATIVTYATLTAKFNAATTPAGTHAAFDTAGLKAALDATPVTAADIAAKAALVTELAKLPTYGQQSIDAATKVAALATAATNVTNATVAGISDYTTKAAAAATLSDTLVKVTAADAAVTAAKLVVDKYTSLSTDILTAQGALNTFKVANADKVSITDVATTVVGSAVQATAKSDVFYFASKAVAANDFAIGGTTNFGAGDSIVLGSAYTYNAGALTTGNSNALEVFLVKGATGTQVVIETEAYGNSTTTVDAAGNVTASPNATVINLVGVTADHLSVANGVVSYV